VVENVPNSLNGRNGNTVNMQRVRCLTIIRTITLNYNSKKKIDELAEDEKTKKTYLSIIGSAVDLRRQTFVLATREMVALQNRSLPQYTSSSHLHHLLRLLRYLRHRTNSLTSLPIPNPNTQTSPRYSFLSTLKTHNTCSLQLQLNFSLSSSRGFPIIYLTASFYFTTHSISETNTNNVKDVSH